VLDYGLEDGRGNVLRRLRGRRKGSQRRRLWRGGHECSARRLEEVSNWGINRILRGLKCQEIDQKFHFSNHLSRDLRRRTVQT
jgi:hypothetical protein